MITLYNGNIPNGMIGCRIKTLARCYKDVKNAFYLYKSDDEAVICRFGQALLVSGTVSKEIFDFADMLGIIQIESSDSRCVPTDWNSKRYPVLSRRCFGAENIPFLRSLSECYNIICSSDKVFAEQTEYLYWLSDIMRRQNYSCAKAYQRSGASAVISAASECEAYLSQVAVLPEKRNEGKATALLSSVFSDSFLSGKLLYTAAQNEALIPFYQKLGFIRLNESLIIFKKEHI